MDWQAHRL